MAKSPDAKKPAAVRLPPDLFAEVEALEAASGTTRTDVLEELIRLGLAVKKGKPDPNRELLDAVCRLREELAEVKAQLAEQPKQEAPSQTPDAMLDAVRGLTKLPEQLGQELASQRRKMVDDITHLTGEQARAVQSAFKFVWFDVLKRLFPKAKPEELKKLGEDAFNLKPDR